MGPPRYNKRSNRDGEKLLCNKCPLKHEGRESGRGEMLYKSTTQTERHHGEPENASTTDIYDT